MQPELIPRRVLFGNPERDDPQISPDGKMIAYKAPFKGIMNVWIKTIGKDDDRVVTKDCNRGIQKYFWAGDGKYIMYLQDSDGDENWRLYGIKLETGEIKNFTPFKDVLALINKIDKHFNPALRNLRLNNF